MHCPAPPPERPLVLIGGHAGSGKTTLGGQLAHRSGLALLDKDILAHPWLVDNPDDRESDHYRQRLRPLEYASLMGLVWENAALGVPVIAVAPFGQELTSARWVADARRRAAGYGLRVKLVWLTADAATMRARLRMRGASRDRRKLSDWTAYVGQLAPAPADCDLVLDTSSGRPGMASEQAHALAVKLGLAP